MTTMRDDQDLERLLRATLAGRAETITRAPDWVAAEPAAPRRRWLAPLIAAAVVAGVAVAAVVGSHSSGHEQPARPTKSSSPSPTPTAIETVQRACTTTLPSAWNSAIAAGTSKLGAASALPLQVTADGSVLVTRDFGTSRDVALVSPTGTVRSIYSVPQPAVNQVFNGAVDGKWAMVPVERGPRFANGVIPTIVRLVIVDLDSHAARTIATDNATDDTHVIDGAALLNGRVYYDVRPRWVSRRGDVHEYDLATGTDRVIASADGLRAPLVVGRGLVWLDNESGLHPQVTRSLPGPVVQGTGSTLSASGLVTDGSAYAWIEPGRQVAWLGPGATVAKRTVVQASGSGNLAMQLVAGPIVLYTDENDDRLTMRVLDTRSGAITALPGLEASGVPLNGLAQGGVLAGDTVTGAEASGTGAPAIQLTALVRIDTAKLPELHC